MRRLGVFISGSYRNQFALYETALFGRCTHRSHLGLCELQALRILLVIRAAVELCAEVGDGRGVRDHSLARPTG